MALAEVAATPDQFAVVLSASEVELICPGRIEEARALFPDDTIAQTAYVSAFVSAFITYHHGR